MKNPFKRLTALELQVADLQAALANQIETNAAFTAQIAALVRDDAQIAALNRIAKATEYTASAEKSDRQTRMVRHEF